MTVLQTHAEEAAPAGDRYHFVLFGYMLALVAHRPEINSKIARLARGV